MGQSMRLDHDGRDEKSVWSEGVVWRRAGEGRRGARPHGSCMGKLTGQYTVVRPGSEGENGQSTYQCDKGGHGETEEDLGHMGGQDLDEDRSGREHRADVEGVGGSLVGSEDLDDSQSCKVRTEGAMVDVVVHHDEEAQLEGVVVACELSDEGRDDVKASLQATGVADHVVKAGHSVGDDEEGHPICDCDDLQNLDEHELAVGEWNVISKVERQGERLGDVEGDDFRHGRVRNLRYGSETLVCVHAWNYRVQIYEEKPIYLSINHFQTWFL